MSLRFGAFELEVDGTELRRDGARLRMPLQALRLLELLASRAGRVVTRDEIRQYLWPADTHVDFEQGINACIRQVRGALDDHADRPRYVETLPKIGYRFIQPVETVDATGDAPSRRWPRAATAVLLAVLAAGAVAAITAIGVHVAPADGPSPAAGDRRPVVMVLPFRNMTGSPDDDPLGDGLTEELIAQLGRRFGASLAVIARTTAMKYRDSSLTIGQIARELDVDYLLEGSIRRGEDGLRITAQLIRGDDESHVWAANYDRGLTDPLAVQTQIGESIAAALGVKLIGRDGLAAAATTPAAYEAYLRGVSALPPTGRQPIIRAREALERAVRLDPGFAAAHVALARAIRIGEPGPSVWSRVRSELELALALDEELPAAHSMMGALLLYADYDREGSRDAYLRALRLNPTFAEAHHGIAAAWSTLGRHDEAIAAVHRALALDPRSESVASDVGWYAYVARRYDEAIAASRLTLEIDPRYFWAHRCIVLSATLNRDLELAAAQARRHLAVLAREGAPSDDARSGSGNRADPASDLDAYWRFDLAANEADVGTGPDRSDQRAVALVALGRDAEAVASLERAVTRRAGWLPPFLAVDPWFDPLRPDPRFRALLARIDDAGPAGHPANRARDTGTPPSDADPSAASRTPPAIRR
ncbi:MAG TPA: winged helix-turn-helix domain-containing protein [Candidatus Polarisedimenticolaceae bacterium]|nr:winged helix-turn-helix domain-containing protein [Candidatus Polarisedimenticolaceae bacterium]